MFYNTRIENKIKSLGKKMITKEEKSLNVNVKKKCINFLRRPKQENKDKKSFLIYFT